MTLNNDYGKPNAKAPPEFSQFAFLIGRWRCDARVKSKDGSWVHYQATWQGKYILDGYVIADEYRMINTGGDVIVHGMNFRTYSSEKKSWIMRWINGAGAYWTELGPEELGGVQVEAGTITFRLIDDFAPEVLSRITFSNISNGYFTWSCDQSPDDGETWAEFMVIEAERAIDGWS